MSTDESDDGPDDGPDEPEGTAGPADATGTPGAPGEVRKRRRRRRRRHGEGGAEGGPPQAQGGSPGQPPQQGPAAPAGDRERRPWQGRGGGEPATSGAAPDASPGQPGAAPDASAGQPGAADDLGQPGSAQDAGAGQPGSGHRSDQPRGERGRRGERRDQRGGRDQQRGGGGGDQQARGPAGDQQTRSGGGQRDQQARGGGQRDQQARGGGQRDQQRRDQPRGDQPPRSPEPAREPAAPSYEAPTARLTQAPRRAPAEDLDEVPTETPGERWGTDDDGPPPVVTLAADLPVEAPAGDLDPLTHPSVGMASAGLGEDIVGVVGVRFVTGGRIQWCDAGDADHAVGERLLVDSDRGARLATVATPPARRATRDRGLRRVIRRANEGDLRGERDGDAERAKILRTAKDIGAQLKLPLKVYRVEVAGERGRGGKLNVYYTSDERLDLRDLVRELGTSTGLRIELRQLGVRDEAKAIGGIGSCGLTLCCTTWLPDFVPVSIKMAKDQGLVLSPTKVAGQCGRLKCCLVYEQAGYAELRKGLPKLGKRVIAPRGEGRVVEVDVLRQRVRVSYGMGDTEVLPAADVKPLFPAGNQPPRAAGGPNPPDAREDEPEVEDDPAAKLPIDDPLLAPPEDDDLGPTDDPSSDHYKPE